MKLWQKGFDIETIEDYRFVFDVSYNKFAKSPFSTWNNTKVADSLSKKRIIEVIECYFEDLGDGRNGKLLYCELNSCAGYIDTHITKTSANIVTYSGAVIGRKLKGDRIINAVAYYTYGHTEEADCATFISQITDYAAFISQINEWREPTWFYIWDEDTEQKRIAIGAGFKKIGVKITSFSERSGIYFRDGDNVPVRDHPVVG